MKKLKLLLIFVMVFALSGCSFLMMNSHKEIDTEGPGTVEEVEKESTMPEESSEPDSGSSIDNPKIPEGPEESKVPEEEPETRPEEKKLDYEILDKLDNTKYSWGLRLNNEHKTPGITSRAKELIEKYDCVFTGDTSKKVVYLTFDEGYENGYTPQILNTLKENNVKSIFFVTGSYVDRNPELVKRMLDEGHEVGSHTVTHPSMPEIDNASIEKELLGLEEKFYEKYGKRLKYLRPPKGEYSERTLEAARQLGYKTVFWSFTYKDWDVNDQKGADYAYNKVMDNLHNGAVILLHAVSKDNTEALDRIIKGIRAEGYEIRPFDF